MTEEGFLDELAGRGRTQIPTDNASDVRVGKQRLILATGADVHSTRTVVGIVVVIVTIVAGSWVWRVQLFGEEVAGSDRFPTVDRTHFKQFPVGGVVELEEHSFICSREERRRHNRKMSEVNTIAPPYRIGRSCDKWHGVAARLVSI